MFKARTNLRDKELARHADSWFPPAVEERPRCESGRCLHSVQEVKGLIPEPHLENSPHSKQKGGLEGMKSLFCEVSSRCVSRLTAGIRYEQ